VLIRAGLLARRRDDRDNRLVRLWLTDAGRALQQPVEAERQSLEQRVTAVLTETEREHLLTALAKIHRSASELLGGPTGHGGAAST
jgi:MarR family transcriptional regulator, organic hydroperoxide resistance regulator